MSTNSLPAGVVNIRGKQYETVALRVHKFRESCPDHSLTTAILHRDELCVVMQATISDAAGRVLATGHAEEYRKASEINRTSALENAETSAIGRALAAFGLGGTEFASADEVARAITGQKGEAVSLKHSPTRLAYESLDEEARAWINNIALRVTQFVQAGDVEAALGYIEEQRLDQDEKAALSGKLDAPTRASIKKYQSAAKEAA